MATDTLGPILQSMLECAEEHLTTPVARARIEPGTQAVWDDCCDGQLYVQIRAIQGSEALSNPRLQPCLPLYTVAVVLGVIRCAHTVDDAGKPPADADITADALLTLQDRADLVEAAVCCIRDMPGLETMTIDTWTPQGVDGGCCGGELALTFKYQMCSECE